MPLLLWKRISHGSGKYPRSISKLGIWTVGRQREKKGSGWNSWNEEQPREGLGIVAVQHPRSTTPYSHRIIREVIPEVFSAGKPIPFRALQIHLSSGWRYLDTIPRKNARNVKWRGRFHRNLLRISSFLLTLHKKKKGKKHRKKNFPDHKVIEAPCLGFQECGIFTGRAGIIQKWKESTNFRSKHN